MHVSPIHDLHCTSLYASSEYRSFKWDCPLSSGIYSLPYFPSYAARHCRALWCSHLHPGFRFHAHTYRFRFLPFDLARLCGLRIEGMHACFCYASAVTTSAARICLGLCAACLPHRPRLRYALSAIHTQASEPQHQHIHRTCTPATPRSMSAFRSGCADNSLFLFGLDGLVPIFHLLAFPATGLPFNHRPCHTHHVILICNPFVFIQT
ncbi:hypothetical protein C8J57DRAFT_1630110, partial [Mycena rebaudengoi]